MTDYEAYLIARGQLWKQELERFDGAVVAELLRSMRQIRREVEAQIAELDLSSPADLLDKERLERLEAWIDSVTAAASSVTEGAPIVSERSDIFMATAQFAHIGMNHLVQTTRVLCVMVPTTKTAKRFRKPYNRILKRHKKMSTKR